MNREAEGTDDTRGRRDVGFHRELDPDRPLPPELLARIRAEVARAGADPAVVVR